MPIAVRDFELSNGKKYWNKAVSEFCSKIFLVKFYSVVYFTGEVLFPIIHSVSRLFHIAHGLFEKFWANDLIVFHVFFTLIILWASMTIGSFLSVRSFEAVLLVEDKNQLKVYMLQRIIASSILYTNIIFLLWEEMS